MGGGGGGSCATPLEGRLLHWSLSVHCSQTHRDNSALKLLMQTAITPPVLRPSSTIMLPASVTPGQLSLDLDCWLKTFSPGQGLAAQCKWSFSQYFLSTWITYHTHNTARHSLSLSLPGRWWLQYQELETAVLNSNMSLLGLHHQVQVLGLEFTAGDSPSWTVTFLNMDKQILCGQQLKQPTAEHLASCRIRQ